MKQTSPKHASSIIGDVLVNVQYDQNMSSQKWHGAIKNL
jgi:hypothetical protein